MEKTTLFSAVKDFINSVGAGNEFTSSQYIYEVGEFEQQTGWKRQNGSHSYRAHQYKGYLKRAGFLESIKHGVWKVLYEIPQRVTLTDINHEIGYTTIHRWDNKTKTGSIHPIKKNPFDFKTYFESCDMNTLDYQPQEVSEGPVRTVYIVSLISGGILNVDYPLSDHSYKTIPFAFEDLDSAEAFAEGIVPDVDYQKELEEEMSKPELDLIAEVESEQDGLDLALEGIQDDIAETLFRESQPDSDPEEMLKFKVDMNTDLEIPLPGGQFVDILIPPGTTIYKVEEDSGKMKMVSIIKDIVYEVAIVVGKSSNIEYEFETEHGSQFTKDDLGVAVFLDKGEATKELSKLV